MFKQVTVYRINDEWEQSKASAEAALGRSRFTPCTPTQAVSMGWIEPTGVPHAPMIETVDGHWLMKLQIESKSVPASVIKKRADEISARIEQQTGRKPGRKEMKELKEQAMHELLPHAFPKTAAVTVWIDRDARRLILDTGSTSKSDEVVTQVVRAMDGMGVALIQTEESAGAVMAAWLSGSDGREPPSDITVDRECELQAPDESKSTIRYANHALDIDEVREHIRHGMLPKSLALTYCGRVSFVLTATGGIKKIKVLGDVEEKDSQAESGFLGDAAILTSELSQLIDGVIEALGGELQGAAPAGD